MSKFLTLKRLFFLVLILIVGFFWWSDSDNENTPLKNISSEQVSSDTLSNIKICEDEILTLEDSIQTLNNEIQKYKKHISVLTTSSVSIYKKYGNEKIYILPKSEYIDVTQFLADRYKDSIK